MGKYGLTLKTMPSGVYPLVAVMGFALGGVAYYITHTIQNPENVFDRKNNRTPWMSVNQNQTTKMYNPTGAFKEKWVRNQL